MKFSIRNELITIKFGRETKNEILKIYFTQITMQKLTIVIIDQ